MRHHELGQLVRGVGLPQKRRQTGAKEAQRQAGGIGVGVQVHHHQAEQARNQHAHHRPAAAGLRQPGRTKPPDPANPTAAPPRAASAAGCAPARARARHHGPSAPRARSAGHVDVAQPAHGAPRLRRAGECCRRAQQCTHRTTPPAARAGHCRTPRRCRRSRPRAPAGRCRAAGCQTARGWAASGQRRPAPRRRWPHDAAAGAAVRCRSSVATVRHCWPAGDRTRR